MNKIFRVILYILAFIASYLTFSVGLFSGLVTESMKGAELYSILGVISFFVALYLTIAKNKNKTVVIVLGLFIFISFLGAYMTRMELIKIYNENMTIPEQNVDG